MKKKGIDVSKHQGRIDWPAVRADGVEFAMIRAGYGMYEHQKDPWFDQNVRGAQSAGIHVGAYHYSYAKSVDDARREAELFLSWLSPHTLDYPAAFDIEDNSQIGLSPELLTEITETFCDRIAAAGFLPMVYANKYWLQNKLIYSRISRYELWLAHYVTATDYDKPHGIWQCTSRAQISGISGNCDLDWCYKDYAARISPPDSPAPQAGYGVCTANSVYVHYLPVAGNHAVLRKLNAGNEVTVFAQDAEWYIVRAGEHYGYVSVDYIQTNPAWGALTKACCTANSVRVRTQPDTSDSANIIRLLNAGNLVDILERRGDWLAVRAGDHVGYAHASYFTEEPPLSRT